MDLLVDQSCHLILLLRLLAEQRLGGHAVLLEALVHRGCEHVRDLGSPCVGSSQCLGVSALGASTVSRAFVGAGCRRCILFGFLVVLLLSGLEALARIALRAVRRAALPIGARDGLLAEEPATIVQMLPTLAGAETYRNALVVPWDLLPRLQGLPSSTERRRHKTLLSLVRFLGTSVRPSFSAPRQQARCGRGSNRNDCGSTALLDSQPLDLGAEAAVIAAELIVGRVLMPEQRLPIDLCVVACNSAPRTGPARCSNSPADPTLDALQTRLAIGAANIRGPDYAGHRGAGKRVGSPAPEEPVPKRERRPTIQSSHPA
mmetsp:Transcript_171207/g.548866  ORF Transcript_171207/g.548866 Transcript_171207/m.548866 type:complete len:317 (+) Transcript_171207:2170-3120(+)